MIEDINKRRLDTFQKRYKNREIHGHRFNHIYGLYRYND